jgi:small subunit ribosomal protein S1
MKNERFADLFEQQMQKTKLYPGQIVTGRIVKIQPEFVIVDAGFKSESAISINQFLDEQGNIEVAEGDEVEVALDAIEDGYGETKLSREKAKRAHAWRFLSQVHESGKSILGTITGRVKGGFTVEIDTIRAFLPGSLVDVRPVRDTAQLEGKEMEFKVIKLDAKRNNVVVSRRAIIESEATPDREALLSKLHEGQEVMGVVKNLTDYGAFVDLGGVDGLLHITDMAWKRVKHPGEVVNVGDEIKVKILKFDREKSRVSLGLKQLGDDPWVTITNKYPVGARLSGKVTNITDYGCFVEIENGIEGLVHVSEMDWTNKNIHPSKVVKLEQEVAVEVLEIDQERRRISLGIKQCIDNPWEEFAKKHGKNERISGAIKSITDFGIFVGLEGDIDGLVHLSDISWTLPGEEAVRQYKKGDEIEALILAIDAERERISLGIKQLEQDPYSNFAAGYEKGSIVSGTVIEVDAKGAKIELTNGAQGYIRASEIAPDRVEDARTHLNVGDTVESKFIGLDKKNRMINLSIKAKDELDNAYDASALDNQGSDAPKLGDLLKEKIGGSSQHDEK